MRLVRPHRNLDGARFARREILYRQARRSAIGHRLAAVLDDLYGLAVDLGGRLLRLPRGDREQPGLLRRAARVVR